MKYLVLLLVLPPAAVFAQQPSSIDPNWQARMPQAPVSVDLKYYQNRITELDFMAARLTTEKEHFQQRAELLTKQSEALTKDRDDFKAQLEKLKAAPEK